MKDGGFSIIEVIVAVVVAGIFILGIYGITGTITTLSIGASQAFTADSLSYANMRAYANGRPPSWFTCPATETDPVNLPVINPTVPVLPPPVTQTIVADAPYGCANAAAGLPIRITSTVTYGPNNRTLKNTTYATY